MLVRKKSSFPLRSDQYSIYCRARAMRESIGGENWTVLGQMNAREGGRENWTVVGQMIVRGRGKFGSALREPNYSIRVTFGRNNCLVHYMCIFPKFQRKGYGKYFMSKVFKCDDKLDGRVYAVTRLIHLFSFFIGKILSCNKPLISVIFVQTHKYFLLYYYAVKHHFHSHVCSVVFPSF